MVQLKSRVPAASRPCDARSDLRFFLLWATLIVPAFFVLALLALRLANITGIAVFSAKLALPVLLITLLGIYCEVRHFSGLAKKCALLGCSIAILSCLIMLVYAAARSPFAFRDSWFVHFDASLGINAANWVSWSATHPIVQKGLSLAYDSWLPMIAITPVLLAMTLRLRAAKRFIVGATTSLVVGIVLFFFFPAIGPWSSFPLHTLAMQRDCEAALLLLHSTGPVEVRQITSAALICFPSFHVVYALIALASLWTFRRARIPLTALVALQIISTVTTGWHYFTDVLGGFVVAGFGLVCAYWFERAEARWNARRARTSETTIGQPADPQPEMPSPTEPVLAG